MTEQSVNQFLQVARRAADNQYRRGNKDNGDYILSVASNTAKDILRAYRLNGEVICYQCMKRFYIAELRDYIREIGMCPDCDHEYDLKIQKMMEEQVN